MLPIKWLRRFTEEATAQTRLKAQKTRMGLAYLGSSTYATTTPLGHQCQNFLT